MENPSKAESVKIETAKVEVASAVLIKPETEVKIITKNK